LLKSVAMHKELENKHRKPLRESGKIESCSNVMVLNRIRQEFRPLLDRLGSSLGKAGITPAMLTATGFLLSFLAGFLFVYRPHEQYLAALSIIAAGIMDALDGAVARSMGRVSLVGSFSDSTLDRVSEIAIFGGIVFANYPRLSSEIVLLALGFSLLVSYVRAKGESLGIVVSGVGVGERAERLLVLIFFSLVGYIWVGVYIILILAIITLIQRCAYIIPAIRRKETGSQSA
jgi:archaetidylinositol phosphate synthase